MFTIRMKWTNYESKIYMQRGEFEMSEKKPPHERMTEKNNGLSSTQEVLYQEEFKKADKAAKNESGNRDEKKKS